METFKRVILHFDHPVYHGECKLWYLLQYDLQPTISHLLNDLSQKLNTEETVTHLYLNDIIIPHWESSRVICFDTDIVKVFTELCVINKNAENQDIAVESSKFSRSNSELDYNTSKKNINSKHLLNNENKFEISLVKSLTKEDSPAKKLQSGYTKTVISNQDVEYKNNTKVQLQVENMDILNSSEKVSPKKEIVRNQMEIVSDDKMEVDSSNLNRSNPYLNPSSVKINNNFKKKFLNTTPTHRDRYTNRSKIYISPGNVKKSSKSSSQTISPAISYALKTAVMETTGCMPANKEQENVLNGSMISQTNKKAEVFCDRVSSIMDKKLKRKVTVADSSSGSSSEDDTSKPPSKSMKPNKIESQNNVPSSDSSSGEEDSKQQDKKHKSPVPKKESSSSSDSSSSSSDEKTSKPAPKLIKLDATLPKNNSKSSSDSTSSSDEEISEEVTKVTKLTSSKHVTDSSSDSDSDDSENEKTSSIKIKSGIIVKNPIPSCTESDASDDDKTAPGKQRSSNIDVTIPLAPKDYSTYSNLEGVPRVSDKLAFKMLDLNESYCPVVSEYKEGVITEYNTTSQQVKVKLLNPVVKQTAGRFELNGSTPIVEDVVELNLKQLIEPKLLPA